MVIHHACKVQSPIQIPEPEVRARLGPETPFREFHQGTSATQESWQQQQKMNRKKIEAVVPSIRLNKLVEKWNERGGAGAKASEKSSEAWLRLCKFVRDHKVTRGQLRYALVKVRGMKESSAGVVASRLLRFQKSEQASAMLDRALAGENVTTRDLRIGVSDASNTTEAIIKAKLRGAARNALDEAMKYDAFIREAGAAYAKARIAFEARQAEAKQQKPKVVVIDDSEAALPSAK
jgi:hypothetical protein